ncbi:MAG: ferredoxin family protein [Actinobacteria bacterium]|nr:ferredoxin family protein [Actinomycetota bacterium]
MTYIIAEPCIDIKDKSCVDVCPVDCIHEFARILIIDPEECIDCFAPSEQLITSHGLRTFAELENKSTRVLTDSGFKPAVVKRFRRRPLVKIELAPAFEERDPYGGTRLTTRNISRFRRTISATPTHQWILNDGQRTDSLAVGQFVPAVSARPSRDSETYRLGILHGLVFGDGPWNKQEIRSGEHLHYVQLYGERMAEYRGFFDQVNFSPWLDVHPGYAGTGVVRSCANVKRLLPETADAEYIAGFVDGWLAADGDPVKAGSWRLRSTDHEALAWLERAAPLAGYVAVGSGQEGSLETNLGVRSRPIRWLYLATREVFWRVMRVESQEADDADTFCAVVPGKHEFALAGGVTTKNCGACEPECPVEAIFPEDALPDKWNAFVEINYAFPEADKINPLVDTYAEEHDVHNEPLE